MKTKLLTISLITFLVTVMLSGPALAQGPASLWPDNTGQQAICRGTRDWGTFISALIDYDDFVEYWKDIFVRYNSNICQYMDIDNLLKRVTKVRKQIRDAFYVCADTSKLKDTYYRLEAELYYLRKYINTDNGSFMNVSDAKMEEDLRNYFVINKGYFSSAQMTQLLSDLKSKYTPRLETYKNCKDATWQNLVDKWNEFKTNAGGIGPAIQQASASISKRWKRMANTPMKGGQSFFGGFVDARINDMPVKEGLELITQELQRNMPQGYTFNQLQSAQTAADTAFNELETFNNYAAEYQALYGETSDEYVKQIVYRLDVLDKAITETFPYENQTYQCVKRINNKQC